MFGKIDPTDPRYVIVDGRRLLRVAGGDVNSETAAKTRLKEIDSQVDELRDTRAEAAKEAEKYKGSLAGEDGKIDTKSDTFRAAKEARKKVGEVDEQIATLQSEKVDLLEVFGMSDPDVDRAKRDNASRSKSRRDVPIDGWDSERLFAAESVRETLSKIAHSSSKNKFGGINLGEVASRDMLAADITGTANMRRGEFYGVLPQLFRPLRVLDLIPTSTMDGNNIPYTRESGDLDAGPLETVEGDLKPEAGVTYEDATADAKTIATWMKIRKQVLADVPALRGIIDNRLRYMVLRRLEKQVLNGDGTGENLEGIRHVSDTGTAGDGTELPADAILDGLTEVLVADGEADAVVVNPYDWRDMLKAKATGGDEQYYSGGPFRATPQSEWGVALIPSVAIARGTALVADFMIGAQLFIREGVNVLLSDSDQDDFLRNKVTLLGEMRAALAVWRPSVFVEVDLGTSGS